MGANDLNVDPHEHTCTRQEWVVGNATLPPQREPEQLWVCGACGRSFDLPQRMVAHLHHAHGWAKARAVRECGLETTRLAREVGGRAR